MIQSLEQPRIEWIWKSNPNPWSPSEPEEWRSYSDLETEIIEEAYNAKRPEAVLDDYHIIFASLVQVSNNNFHNQRPVQRKANIINGSRLREERFLPNPMAPSTPFNCTFGTELFFCSVWESCNLAYDDIQCHFLLFQHFEHELNDPTTRRTMVEKAAEGIAIEGKKVSKQKEGEWLAKRLLKIKEGTKQEVWECCVRLYCLESFLYKRLNEWMRFISDREHKTFWDSKVATFGPFAVLLWAVKPARTGDDLTVYRGVNLPDDLIEQYQHVNRQGSFCFPAFTSTSRNRAKAEAFGNVLFVMDIKGWEGVNVTSYSSYDEEEQLIDANFGFSIQSCTFDNVKKKWIIHLQSAGFH